MLSSVLSLLLLPNIYPRPHRPQRPAEVLAHRIGPEDCSWIMGHLYRYGIVSQGASLVELLQSQDLDDFEQLEICGFTSDDVYTESMTVSLLRTLIPARKACEIFGAPGLLSGYTDQQLSEAGIHTCQNLVIAGAESFDTMAGFDANGVNIIGQTEAIYNFIGTN